MIAFLRKLFRWFTVADAPTSPTYVTAESTIYRTHRCVECDVETKTRYALKINGRKFVGPICPEHFTTVVSKLRTS